MLFALLAEGAAHGAEHAEGGSPAFPPFEPWHMPSQLFWLAILFTVMYFALSRFILPKMSDTIEKRSDRIASDLDQATALNEQATEAQQALELRIAQAKAKARETAAKASAKIDAEMAAETGRVDAEIENLWGFSDDLLLDTEDELVGEPALAGNGARAAVSIVNVSFSVDNSSWSQHHLLHAGAASACAAPVGAAAGQPLSLQLAGSGVVAHWAKLQLDLSCSGAPAWRRRRAPATSSTTRRPSTSSRWSASPPRTPTRSRSSGRRRRGARPPRRIGRTSGSSTATSGRRPSSLPQTPVCYPDRD